MASIDSVFYIARIAPSVKTLVDRLEIDEKTARRVKDVLSGKVDLMTIDGARRRQEQAYHPHPGYLLALEACNELLETHGVEYIRSSEDTCYEGKGLEYCNTGDPYLATLIYDAGKDSWHAACWGDLIEADSDRFGE